MFTSNSISDTLGATLSHLRGHPSEPWNIRGDIYVKEATAPILDQCIRQSRQTNDRGIDQDIRNNALDLAKSDFSYKPRQRHMELELPKLGNGDSQGVNVDIRDQQLKDIHCLNTTTTMSQS